MSGPRKTPTRRTAETVDELRERLGLFSFRHEAARVATVGPRLTAPDLGLGPGVIVEWLIAGPGSGALTAASQITSRCLGGRGRWVVVDPSRESYVPALTGWDMNPSRILLLRPANLRETCWAIEQCLRCAGVSVTWAWLGNRVPTIVHRRWKLAAVMGGGVGLLFRPDQAHREPAWADLRLRVTPLSGRQGDTRRIKVDVLYRRGGLGGSAQVWEIDHAAGDVRLVSEVADPAIEARTARA
jgi:protein ImuA